MKIKNAILSTLTTSILVCGSTQANVGNMNNNTTEEESLCEAIASFSLQAMSARQSEVDYGTLSNATPTPNTDEEREVKVVLDAIVKDVYNYPIHESQKDKEQLIYDYSISMYDVCLYGD